MANTDPPGSGAANSRDDDESRRLAALGPQLLLRFSAMIRTARTHNVANQAFQRQLQEFNAIVQELLQDTEDVTLVAVADYLYLDGHRIKVSASLLPVYHGILGEFERRSMGGIRVINGAHPAELERFFQLFMAAEDPAIAENIGRALDEARIEHLQVIQPTEVDADELAKQMDEPKEKTERGRAGGCSGARCSAPSGSSCAHSRPAARSAAGEASRAAGRRQHHEARVLTGRPDRGQGP
jgi:hypothetical protein